MAVVVALVVLVLAATLALASTALRREIVLWRWRQRHPARIRLTLDQLQKKRPAA